MEKQVHSYRSFCLILPAVTNAVPYLLVHVMRIRMVASNSI